MKRLGIIFSIGMLLCGCKQEAKKPTEHISETLNNPIDSVIEVVEVPEKKSIKHIKEALTAKGFNVMDYVDETTQDTILMQQYFIAFLKKGPIHGQNEEENVDLQKAHLAHLTQMYDLGYADISGPFGDDGDIRGITIYNVPNLKMADSLAHADPMVKAGRLVVEVHPWWAAKGFSLR
ncbi:YciI family protein [Aestuariivivens sediminis]|uniref:YciI family protein n=1 Tax=Aestuariivivens sediminis TaxID=2913557 RepID=UPI001F582D49|nr:YciI family protein [Aestuariivivens sediminis]